MSATKEEEKADEARAALLSDIADLKRAEHAMVGKAASTVPWIASSAVGLLAIGALIGHNPRRRLLGRRRSTLLGGAARAIALSAIGVLTRSLVSRALNKALPERARVPNLPDTP